MTDEEFWGEQTIPDDSERLTDSEISRIKREAIDLADAHKEPGKSAIREEMLDRDRMSTRKSFWFVRPW